MPFDEIIQQLENLREGFRQLPTWSLRLVLALFSLSLILLLRRIVVSQVERRLRRWLEERDAPQTEAIIDALILPVQLLIVAAALSISIRILSPDDGTVAFLTPLINSLAVVAGFVALFRLVDIFALDSSRLSTVIGMNFDERLMPLLRTTLRVLVFVLAVVTIMGEWGVNLSGLLASIGIVGLAFSLAAQNTISNVFGFSTIIGDRTFRIGEFIKSGSTAGVVEDVGIRSTRIRKSDGGVIIVPNSDLANAPIERFQRRRVDFTLGITYTTTADQMEALLKRLREMLGDRDMVIRSSVAVHFMEFGESSLNIAVLCDVTARNWRMLRDEQEQINLAVMRIVAEEGLSIAFPTRSLYIENMPQRRTDDDAPETIPPPEDAPDES